jgi:dynein heavy chain
VYQALFDDRARKWFSYQEGEKLYGLEQTQYPDLERIRKELRDLHQLYGLYSDVIITVNRYDDTLWAELDLDQVELQISDYQGKCRGMPKRIMAWDSYKELRKMVDEFVDVIETLKSLKQEFIRDRHWTEIQRVCGTQFKTDTDVFKLGHLRNAGLVKHVEEIDEIASGCAKEAEIEAKLQDIMGQWAGQEFVFMTFKNRGELLLKGTSTSEMLTTMEDSQMALQGLLSNRYNAPFKDRIVDWNTKLTVCQYVFVYV